MKDNTVGGYPESVMAQARALAVEEETGATDFAQNKYTKNKNKQGCEDQDEELEEPGDESRHGESMPVVISDTAADVATLKRAVFDAIVKGSLSDQSKEAAFQALIK